jgi:DNA-binding XRE family transcriptional regulator
VCERSFWAQYLSIIRRNVQYIEVQNLNTLLRFSHGFARVFAANLRRLRHAKGLSQDDLAYEAEVSRSYLSQLEKGAFYASLKVVAKLATVLEVEPAELLKMPVRPSQRRKQR